MADATSADRRSAGHPRLYLGEARPLVRAGGAGPVFFAEKLLSEILRQPFWNYTLGYKIQKPPKQEMSAHPLLGHPLLLRQLLLRPAAAVEKERQRLVALRRRLSGCIAVLAGKITQKSAFRLVWLGGTIPQHRGGVKESALDGWDWGAETNAHPSAGTSNVRGRVPSGMAINAPGRTTFSALADLVAGFSATTELPVEFPGDGSIDGGVLGLFVVPGFGGRSRLGDWAMANEGEFPERGGLRVAVGKALVKYGVLWGWAGALMVTGAGIVAVGIVASYALVVTVEMVGVIGGGYWRLWLAIPDP